MSQETFHILLVEDEDAHAMLIKRAFERSESLICHMTRVGTLAEARRALALSPPPGLAIVDAHLPDGKGIELLEGSPCPMVIMTSQEHSRTAVEAHDLGALDYVVKSPRIFRDLPGIAQRLMESQNSDEGLSDGSTV